MPKVPGRKRGKRLRRRQILERVAELRKAPWDDSITWSDFWGRKYARARTRAS